MGLWEILIAAVGSLLSLWLSWLQGQNKHRREEAQKMTDVQLSVQTRLTQLETWRLADLHRIDGFEQRVIASLERLEDKIDRLVER